MPLTSGRTYESKRIIKSTLTKIINYCVMQVFLFLSANSISAKFIMANNEIVYVIIILYLIHE